MKTWLKGGLIGGIIGIVLIILVTFIAYLTVAGDGPAFLSVFFFIGEFISTITGIGYYTSTIISNFIIGFIIGALIGFIIEK